MSVARNPARERNRTVTRRFLLRKAQHRVSADVLSDSQSPFILGSQYGSNHFTFNAADLSTSAQEWIRQHDLYRVMSAEMFVTAHVESRTNTTKQTVPIHHYCYVDPDTSESQSSSVTPWYDIIDRENLARVVLRANNPSIKIATWSPRPLFSPVSGDNPANVIPDKQSWIDSLILTQEHSGVRSFACCPVESPQNDAYRFFLDYEIRVTIQCKAPL